MTLKKAALAKDSAIKFLWIDIVYGVKIYDIMFILCFILTFKQFWANDYLYSVALFKSVSIVTCIVQFDRPCRFTSGIYNVAHLLDTCRRQRYM